MDHQHPISKFHEEKKKVKLYNHILETRIGLLFIFFYFHVDVFSMAPFLFI